MSDDLTTAKKHLRAARKLLQNDGGSEAQQLLTRLEAKPQNNTMLYVLAGVMLIAGLAAGFAGGFLTRPDAEPDGVEATNDEPFFITPELCDFSDWSERNVEARSAFLDTISSLDSSVMAQARDAYASVMRDYPDCRITQRMYDTAIEGMDDIIRAFSSGDRLEDPDYVTGFSKLDGSINLAIGYLLAANDMEAYILEVLQGAIGVMETATAAAP